MHVLKKQQSPIEVESQEAIPPTALNEEQLSQYVTTEESPPLRGYPHNKATPEELPVTVNKDKFPQGVSHTVTHEVRQPAVNKEEEPPQSDIMITHDGSLHASSPPLTRTKGEDSTVPANNSRAYSWTWGWTATTISIAIITSLVCVCYKLKYRR